MPHMSTWHCPALLLESQFLNGLSQQNQERRHCVPHPHFAGGSHVCRSRAGDETNEQMAVVYVCIVTIYIRTCSTAERYVYMGCGYIHNMQCVQLCTVCMCICLAPYVHTYVSL